MGVGCPGNTTNYRNKPPKLKVTFTFGVNSVCAYVLVYMYRDSSLLGNSVCFYLREWSGQCEEQRDNAERPKKITQKFLWKCHKVISWMSVGQRKMGFDIIQPWPRRVGRYMATVTQLWLVEHLRFYDPLPFGAVGQSSADHITN